MTKTTTTNPGTMVSMLIVASQWEAGMLGEPVRAAP